MTAANEDNATAAGMVTTIIGETVAMNYEGDVKAVAIAIIDKDGDARTLFAFAPGTKLPLLAAITLLEHELVSAIRPFKKLRDSLSPHSS